MDAVVQHLQRELDVLTQIVSAYQQVQDAITEYNLQQLQQALSHLDSLVDTLHQLERERFHIISQTLQISPEEARRIRTTRLLEHTKDGHLQKTLFHLQQAFKEQADKLQRTVIITSFLIRRAFAFSESVLEALLGKNQSLYNVRA